ncbi:hypothetical protein [Falsihalocynthiibacter sp. CO-5D18]|uniref:hypothetical protein n=1 Tax=Falsihalocynthiibacter sp. CO-5D18 TaxID=3240872 RepID=UPI0035100F9A
MGAGRATIVGKTYFGCANARNKGTCNNRLSILQADLEGRVLSGLKDHLLHPDLIAEFARSYQEEYNRLAATIGQDHAKAGRDLAQVTKQIDAIVDAISNGMLQQSMKAKLDALEAQKATLEAKLAETDSNPPVLLHPDLAVMYRSKVADLTDALNEPSTRTESGEIIRRGKEGF